MDKLKTNQQCGNCPIHQNKTLIYVCTDPKQSNSLKCATCIIKDNVFPNQIIEIEDILNCNSKTVFFNWPLKEDPDLIEKIQKKSMKELIDFKLKEKINTYFNELKLSINNLIDSLNKDMLRKAEDIWNFNEDIVSVYNELSNKQAIKDILNDSSLSFVQKNTELKEIITKVDNNQQQYKETISDLFENKKTKKREIDFEKMKEIQTKIMILIQKIDIVVANDIKQLKPNIVIPFINYGTSKLQIVVDEIGSQITQQINVDQAAAVSKFSLDNNLAYVITCTFNRSYNIDPGSISIGLIPENLILQQYPQISLEKLGFCSQKKSNLKVIKGYDLQSKKLSSIISCIEFRICVANQELYFADYPNYKNINQIQKERIDFNKLYRFGVWMNQAGNNFSIRIDKIRILKDKSKLSAFQSY